MGECSRARGRVRGLVAGMLLAVLTSGGSVRGREQDNSLPVHASVAEATAALRHWREDLQTLRLECETIWRSSPQQMTRFDWAWTRDGRVRLEHSARSHGESFSHGAWVTEDEYHYHFYSRDGQRLRLDQIETRESRQLIAPFRVPALSGLWIRDGDLWLSDVFDSEHVEAAGSQTYQNRRLPRFRVALPSGHAFWVALDPEYDWLPRFIESWDALAALPQDPVGWRGEVHEFQRLETTGQWFPLAGLETMWVAREGTEGERIVQDEHVWLVTSIAVNGDLPRDVFRPDLDISGVPAAYAPHPDDIPTTPQRPESRNPGFWSGFLIPIAIVSLLALWRVTCWFRRPRGGNGDHDEENYDD